MSNPFVQLQTQEQGEIKSTILSQKHFLTSLAGPPGLQNFAQPTSSNPTSGECLEDGPLNEHNVNFSSTPDFETPELPPDNSFHAEEPKVEKDGPRQQVGHFCRLPNGQMEWVHNPYLPRGEEYQAEVQMTTPLPEGSTSHVENESGSPSRRSVMATMFKKRMQTLRENRARKGNKEVPRINPDPPQANLPADPMESIQMVTDMSPALTAKSPNSRPNPQPVQQIPVSPSQYQKRPNRVSKNTLEPRRQVRTKAVLARMETVLEDEAETQGILPPSDALIPLVIEEDYHGPMQYEFVDDGFEHENRRPIQYNPPDYIPAVEPFHDGNIGECYSSTNGF